MTQTDWYEWIKIVLLAVIALSSMTIIEKLDRHLNGKAPDDYRK